MKPGSPKSKHYEMYITDHYGMLLQILLWRIINEFTIGIEDCLHCN